DLGECSRGTQICSGGRWGVCMGEVRPQSEICDTLDNDCDGDVDEGCDPFEVCVPGDKKDCLLASPGVCGVGEITCQPDQTWGACLPVFIPGDLLEDCSSGEDEDCDGHTDCSDPDCATDSACTGSGGCTPGDTQECLTGLLGLCGIGVQECQSDRTWGSCVTLFSPGDVPEDCSSGADEDCDGATDCSDSADCSADPACTVPGCVPGDIKTCSLSVPGICGTGQMMCQPDETWGACTAVWNPGDLPEDCSSGADEDCDGYTDCSDPDCAADPACSGGSGCTPGDTKACATGYMGVCGTGQQTCQPDRTWGACDTLVLPGDRNEDCSNGLDDDCDGATDCSDPLDCAADPACSGSGGCTPGETRQCGYNDLGECELGTQMCPQSGDWADAPCVGAKWPTIENCGDGLDNDCDGDTDMADLDCGGGLCAPPGSMRQCGYSDIGECSMGTQICQGDLTWGPCNSPLPVYPKSEICGDGLDQDCNGIADEFCTTTTCVWNPVCTVGVDCEEQANPDAGTPLMFGWVWGLIDTAKSWSSWPDPPCTTNGVTGVVTCDFFYQTASRIEPNVNYTETPRSRWHAECVIAGPCDPGLADLRRVGVITCTNGGNPVVFGYTLNPSLNGYNGLFEQP
ncbi:hypothetical protein KKG41_07185, partial [Patescibacteria group bacterium]|nr:hypothetical protein [Patescibacteria group bacterium]